MTLIENKAIKRRAGLTSKFIVQPVWLHFVTQIELRRSELSWLHLSDKSATQSAFRIWCLASCCVTWLVRAMAWSNISGRPTPSFYVLTVSLWSQMQVSVSLSLLSNPPLLVLQLCLTRAVRKTFFRFRLRRTICCIHHTARMCRRSEWEARTPFSPQCTCRDVTAVFCVQVFRAVPDIFWRWTLLPDANRQE